MGPLHVALRPGSGGAVVLAVSGRLDAGSAPRLQRWLDRVTRTRCDVLLDLSGVTAADAEGRRVVAEAEAAAVLHGRLLVAWGLDAPGADLTELRRPPVPPPSAA